MNSMPWILVPFVGTLLPLFVHYGVRGRSGLARAALVVFGVALVLPLPWLIPVELGWVRFVLGMVGLLAVAHLLEVAFVRYPDPAMHTSLGRFLCYWLNGPDARWPVSTAERRQARRAGARRLVRALLKAAAMTGMVGLGTAVPLLHDWWFVRLLWVVWTAYFFCTACFDVGAGTFMLLSGVGLDEIFNLPPLADSPRDFWSRRWNMMFRNVVHRLVFQPLQGHRRPHLVVPLVFAISALAHEYLVVASLGDTRGEMTIFFAIHGAATLGHGLLTQRRRGRPLLPRFAAVALHMVWFTATSHFFFKPFLKVFPFDRWRL